MTIDSKQLKELTVEDRLTLLDAVWDSFDDCVVDFPIPESHKRELDRRLADEEATPNSGEPWEVVKKRLLNGL
jgi:putative addiction module component (TIGR02574 family)